MARDVRNNVVRAPKGAVLPNKNAELRSDVVVKAKDLTNSLQEVNDRLKLLEFPQAVAIEADSPWENSDFTTDLQTILNYMAQYPHYGFVFEGSSLDSLSATVNLGPPLVEPAATGSAINRSGLWQFTGSFSYQGAASEDLVGVQSGTLMLDDGPIGWYVIPKDDSVTVTGAFNFVRGIDPSGSIPDLEFLLQDASSGPIAHDTSDVKGFARFLGAF